MIYFLVYFVLCFTHLDIGFSLRAGKNISLTKLYSIKLSDIPDIRKNIKRNYEGLGLDARQDSASLGQNVTLFRLHRPGFQHVDRSVALESNLHPGLFLRYKNYKFRMEKAKPTGLFEKDSTFLERNPFGGNSIALELFNHPGWYVCHDTTKPFVLKAASKVVRSREFDEKCVFRQAILKVYGPNPKTDKDKEQQEAKAAEILDSLVSKEAVGEILAANPIKQPGQARQSSQKTLQQGTKIVGPVLAHVNKGLKMRPPNQRAAVSRGSYQSNQQTNSYNSAVKRMRYLNNLRRKGFAPKPFSRVSQNAYTGYMRRISVKPLQRSQYGVPYNVPHKLAQYSREPSTTYRNTWPRIRPHSVYSGLDLHGGPGSMRPGNVLHMVRKPQGLSNTAHQNPVKNQVNRFPKAPAYNFVTANKPLQYNARPLTRPISSGNQVTSLKSRPINSMNKMTSSISHPFRSSNQMTSLKPRPVNNANLMTSLKSRPITSSDHVMSLEVKPIVWGGPVLSSKTKPTAKPGSKVQSGSGSGETPVAKHREPKPVDPNRAVYGLGDKCISIRFFNRIRKPIKIVSSMKREGYLVTAETFKLRTIFKHARKDRKVHFYAQDMNDKEDVLLNNNNVVTVIPGPCDLPYRSIYLSRNGQFSNNEVENFLKAEEQKESGVVQGKGVILHKPNPQDGFSQWSDFGPCSTTCGTGFQLRHRVCMPGRACLGTTKESRACIHAPCSEPYCVQTYGGNVGTGKCCALPFIFQDTVYDKCITHASTGSMWCSTTPNYDLDKSWGFCKLTERRSNMFYRPQRYPGLAPDARKPSLNAIQNTCPKSCYSMCVPGCHATCCSAHALAFPSVSKKKSTPKHKKKH